MMVQAHHAVRHDATMNWDLERYIPASECVVAQKHQWVVREHEDMIPPASVEAHDGRDISNDRQSSSARKWEILQGFAVLSHQVVHR